MSRRVRGALGAVLLVLAFAPAAEARDGAAHSLRAPVTGENFYFVMADRFENGSSANDKGGLGDDPQVSGYDRPTRAITTAATSRACSTASTTSTSSARPRSG